MKIKLWKKLESFETHHKVGAFVLIMIVTIILTRLSTSIHNPNPALFSFELHHFDYGLIILMLTTMFLLFGKERNTTHLFLSAIGFGLIVDDYWFIRSNIVDPTFDELLIYASTIPFMIGFLITVIVLILLIKKVRN